MKALSLFSSGGIGDLAMKKLGIDVVVSNEIVESRIRLHRRNFPDSKVIEGDIRKKTDEIIESTQKYLNGKELDFLFATPPCQGMSKNGQGKLLRGVREGRKPKYDERNQLIIPTINIIKKLRPRVVFFENVPEMVNTVIEDRNRSPINLIDFIEKELGKEYIGKPEVIQFADFGVPQRRSRLLTIYSNDKTMQDYFKLINTYLPEKTHGNPPQSRQKPWVTVRDIIGELPELDGKNIQLATSSIPFHRVPVLDPKKYIWISNTPPEKGAFDNQCTNPLCKYQGNLTHGATKNHEGINRANGHTPLYCEVCGEMLPRPFTITADGSRRIMAGYTSAYKRMRWELPAPTLTTNLSYPSSDHKLHPEQNRVLSLHEAFLLHTLDKFNYQWKFENGEQVPDTLITEVIGESIPPMGIYIILKNILRIMNGEAVLPNDFQLSLIG